MQTQTCRARRTELRDPRRPGLLADAGRAARAAAAAAARRRRHQSGRRRALARAAAREPGGRRNRAASRSSFPTAKRFKSWSTLQDVLTRLLEQKAERATTLVALGGGVVGDIAGFAAAIYQRGMPFVQVPTTLLAQVDSSVGGKTGINHPLGKNMIGAFHQPRAVRDRHRLPATLPDRELAAGLAEVIKTAAIRDRAFFEWLEANLPTPRRARRRCAGARGRAKAAGSRRRSSPPTSAKPASARCSTSATRSATRSKRASATANGCTAKRSPRAWCSRRGCPSGSGSIAGADVDAAARAARARRAARRGAAPRRRALARADGPRQEGRRRARCASCCCDGVGDARRSPPTFAGRRRCARCSTADRRIARAEMRNGARTGAVLAAGQRR